MINVSYKGLEVFIHYENNKNSAWVYCHKGEECETPLFMKFKVNNCTIDEILLEVDRRIKEPEKSIIDKLTEIGAIKSTEEINDGQCSYKNYFINKDKYLVSYLDNTIYKIVKIYNKVLDKYKYRIDFLNTHGSIINDDEELIEGIKVYKNIKF